MCAGSNISPPVSRLKSHKEEHGGMYNTAAQGQTPQRKTYHQHQDHGTLIDVVCVDAGPFPKPAPEFQRFEKTFSVIQKTLVSSTKGSAGLCCVFCPIWHQTFEYLNVKHPRAIVIGSLL